MCLVIPALVVLQRKQKSNLPVNIPFPLPDVFKPACRPLPLQHLHLRQLEMSRQVYLDKTALQFYSAWLQEDSETPDVEQATEMIKRYSVAMDRDSIDELARLFDMKSTYTLCTLSDCSEA